MNKIKNNENVIEIVMRPKAYTKCQIGQDWFMNAFEVIFEPKGYYPDYMEVQKFIDENIEGHEMNIEVAAHTLCEYLKEYDPYNVMVKDHITNCNTHFDVDVTVE